MHIPALFIGLAATLLPATVHARCAQGTKSRIVTFESLKDGQTVPNFFPKDLPYNWTNFQAASYVANDYHLKSSDNSKIGALITDQLGARIGPSGQVNNIFKDSPNVGSFEFGCTDGFYNKGFARNCSLGLLSQDLPSFEAKTRGHGSFDFITQSLGAAGKARMTKVDLPDSDVVNLVQFFGYLTQILGALVLDNIEFCYSDS